MVFFVVIIIGVVFVSGFVIVDKIGNIKASHSFLTTTEDLVVNKQPPEALVFGTSEYSQELNKLLDENGISYDIAKDIADIDKAIPYSMMFAVDQSDLENLTACSIGKKMMGIPKMIAICHYLEYRKIFSDNEIAHLYGENATASLLLTIMLSSKKARNQ